MGHLVELQASSLLLLHGVNKAIPHINHLSHSHFDYFCIAASVLFKCSQISTASGHFNESEPV